MKTFDGISMAHGLLMDTKEFAAAGFLKNLGNYRVFSIKDIAPDTELELKYDAYTVANFIREMDVKLSYLQTDEISDSDNYRLMTTALEYYKILYTMLDEQSSTKVQPAGEIYTTDKMPTNQDIAYMFSSAAQSCEFTIKYLNILIKRYREFNFMAVRDKSEHPIDVINNKMALERFIKQHNENFMSYLTLDSKQSNQDFNLDEIKTIKVTGTLSLNIELSK